jgi:hypothetical protein
LRINNLRLLDATADIIIRRETLGVAVEVPHKTGDIEIFKSV